MEVGGWVQVSLGICFGKSSKNSLKSVLIFWSSIPCVFCLYTLLKVVGYYDFSVLSMPVMGFRKKKVWMGMGGWGELYPKKILDFLNFFELCKAPYAGRGSSVLARASVSRSTREQDSLLPFLILGNNFGNHTLPL